MVSFDDVRSEIQIKNNAVRPTGVGMPTTFCLDQKEIDIERQFAAALESFKPSTGESNIAFYISAGYYSFFIMSAVTTSISKF